VTGGNSQSRRKQVWCLRWGAASPGHISVRTNQNDAAWPDPVDVVPNSGIDTVGSQGNARGSGYAGGVIEFWLASGVGEGHEGTAEEVQG
jgi:hypothetical protein